MIKIKNNFFGDKINALMFNLLRGFADTELIESVINFNSNMTSNMKIWKYTLHILFPTPTPAYKIF